MTNSNSPDPSMDETTTRFHAILDGDQEDEPTPAPEPPRSFLDRRPRAVKPASPPAERTPRRPSPARATMAPPPPEAGANVKSRAERYHRAFWDVTSWVGLIVDVITIAVVIILLLYVRRLNIKVNELMRLTSMPVETVSGLYNNFEKMNTAHIVTTIPYETQIPVQFDLQINTQTEVVLSQNTPINGARVTLTTGGLEISGAPANIVLPAGTRLPITLALTVPVNKTVPVSLNVPVDINLAQTDLGVPFTGLMDVLEPLYCLLDPKSVDSAGISICEKAKTP